jgi:membrane-associated phospholipid phosphatase
VAAQASAQSDTTRKAGKPLFTRNDAWLALGFAGLTVAMFPADKALARHLREPSSSENQFIAKVTTGSETLAHPGGLIVASAAYVAGKVTHKRTLADVGLHSAESIILATGITGLVKDVAGRARPYLSNGDDPKDFKFGGGFNSDDRRSFPSGHSTAAFAAASALTSEVKRWYPNATWIVGPVMYSGATVVGLSRMYHNKHWASDVVLGAAVGTFSGIKVVRYSHNHPDNPVDRRLLGITVGPNGEGGQVVGLSVPWEIGSR